MKRPIMTDRTCPISPAWGALSTLGSGYSARPGHPCLAPVGDGVTEPSSMPSARVRTLARSAEGDVDALVGQRLVAGQGADIGRDERFNAVAHPLGDFAQRYAGPKPRRRRRMATVVDTH